MDIEVISKSIKRKYSFVWEFVLWIEDENTIWSDRCTNLVLELHRLVLQQVGDRNDNFTRYPSSGPLPGVNGSGKNRS